MTHHPTDNPDDDPQDEEPHNPGAGTHLRRVAGSLATAIRRAIAAADDPDIVVDGDAIVSTVADHSPASQDRGSTQRSRTARIRPTATDRCRIDVRTEDETLVVVADVRQLDPADLSVRLGGRSDVLVIVDDGTVVGRVDLPWTDVTREAAQLHNGILTIRLRRNGT